MWITLMEAVAGMNIETLMKALVLTRPRVIEHVFEQLYANPFWDARYGERGRQAGRKDLGYHVDALSTALSAGDPGMYARDFEWFRTAIVLRGACTRHVIETLDALSAGYRLELPAEAWEWIEPYQSAAALALRYAHPVCQALDQVADTVAEEAARRMQAEPQPKCKRDFLYHLSYLNDALGLGDSYLFVRYLRWVGPFLESFGYHQDTLVRIPDALRSALNAVMGEDSAAPLVEMIP